jgi:hypothetical protein
MTCEVQDEVNGLSDVPKVPHGETTAILITDDMVRH